MASPSGRIQAIAAAAVAQRHRTGLATTGIALLSLAALLVTNAVLNAAPRTARALRDTERTPFFLVASPDMPDPLFQQTVILMLPPTAMPIVAGIVINKPTKITLGELFSHAPAIRNQAQSVYFGGPVELASPVVLMRAVQAPDATAHLFENVYMSIDPRSIADILKRPGSEKDVRLFLGRAQWTVDQLHAEILKGAWTLAPARPELVFSSDPAGVWRILAQHAKMREVDLSGLEQAFGWCARGQPESTLSQARWIGPPE